MAAAAAFNPPQRCNHCAPATMARCACPLLPLCGAVLGSRSHWWRVQTVACCRVSIGPGSGATGMRGVEFSAAIYRGLSRLGGPGSGISGGEQVLTSTGCWFRPAPRMPLCAAPVGCFVALWYRVRLLIWPRANPSRMQPGGRSREVINDVKQQVETKQCRQPRMV